MIDFDALLLRPAYRVFAEPAELTIGSTVHQADVIDGTRGIAVEEGGPIAVETIRPVADVRRSQLAQKGITVSQLIDAVLVLGGQTWRVKTPLELNRDEVRLILIAEDVDVNVAVVRLPQVHDAVRQGLITPFIALSKQKGRVAYHGDGRNRWPAAPVDDVARLYRLAVEKARRFGSGGAKRQHGDHTGGQQHPDSKFPHHPFPFDVLSAPPRGRCQSGITTARSTEKRASRVATPVSGWPEPTLTV